MSLVLRPEASGNRITQLVASDSTSVYLDPPTDRTQIAQLYVGNLPHDGCEIYLRQVLHAQEISFTNLHMKRGGYAFVECTDQNMADRAIDKLNGHCFLGTTLHVEPVAPTLPNSNPPSPLLLNSSTTKQSGGTRFIINNVPNNQAHNMELQELVTQFGAISVERPCMKIPTLFCTFKSPEDRQRATKELHGRNFHGQVLSIETIPRRPLDPQYVDSPQGPFNVPCSSPSPPQVIGNMQPTTSDSNTSTVHAGRRLPPLRPQRPRRRRGGMSAPVPALPEPPMTSNSTDFPLRLLVPGEMVGAIIGRQGMTIRRIIKETRARVDVHRKDSARSEQALTIYGKPENCSAACRRILLVMQEEARTNGETQHRAEDLSIKVMTQSNLIGRLIGKGGCNIRRIMEETGARISVISERGNSNESVVVIQGDTQSMLAAEARVSGKLRQSFEADRAAIQSLAAAPLTVINGMINQNGLYTPLAPSANAEVVYLHVPHRAGAAIIGARGNYIRELMRQSGAYIRVPSLSDPDGDPGPQNGQSFRRKIIIIGNPEAQWKAQWLINEKLRDEGWKDAPLTVELRVPARDITKIIGRKGENIAALRRATGTTIHLPWCDEEGMQTILISGSFQDIQIVQKKLRDLMSSAASRSGNFAPGALNSQYIRKDFKALALTSTQPSMQTDFGLGMNATLNAMRGTGLSMNLAPLMPMQLSGQSRSTASSTPPPLRDIFEGDLEEGTKTRLPPVETEQRQIFRLEKRSGVKPIVPRRSEGFRPGDEWGITIVELDAQGNRLTAQEAKVENAKRDTLAMLRSRAAAGGNNCPTREDKSRESEMDLPLPY